MILDGENVVENEDNAEIPSEAESETTKTTETPTEGTTAE